MTQGMNYKNRMKGAQAELEKALLWAQEVPDNYDVVDHIVRALFLISNRQYETEVDRVTRLTSKAYEWQKKYSSDASEEHSSEHGDFEGSAESSDTPTYEALKEVGHIHDGTN